MIRKKSKFWTFWFSFIPGAAEMYMGFMKMGLSLMTIFFGLFALSVTLELGPGMVLVAISWFYSFFHAHNLASMPEQEFYEIEDTYLFTVADAKQGGDLIRTYRKTFAIVLIFIGGVLTWKTCMSMLYGIIPYMMYNALSNMTYRLPQLVVGIAIVYLGVAMIRGKKVELDEQARSNEAKWNNSDQNNYAANEGMNTEDENESYNSLVHVNAIEDKKEGN
nr:hypothetical protein [uncultured Anaerosporobacter sp.]